MRPRKDREQAGIDALSPFYPWLQDSFRLQFALAPRTLPQLYSTPSRPRCPVSLPSGFETDDPWMLNCARMKSIEARLSIHPLRFMHPGLKPVAGIQIHHILCHLVVLLISMREQLSFYIRYVHCSVSVRKNKPVWWRRGQNPNYIRTRWTYFLNEAFTLGRMERWGMGKNILR